MMKFVHAANRFEPTENFFNPISSAQAYIIAFMACGASNKGRVIFLLGNLSGGFEYPPVLDKLFKIISLVGTFRDPAATGDLIDLS